MSRIALAVNITHASLHTAPAKSKIKGGSLFVFCWKILCHWVAAQGNKISLEARILPREGLSTEPVRHIFLTFCPRRWWVQAGTLLLSVGAE